MNFEFFALVIPFFTIPVFLVSLNYFNESAELDRKRLNVIDFDKFIKNKQTGDVVDIDIAKLLDIEKIVA